MNDDKTKSAAADLDNAPAEQDQENTGVIVPLMTKDGEPALDSKGNPVTVTVLGEYSDKLRERQERQQKQQMKDGFQLPKPGELRARQIDAAAAAVTAWEGVEAGKQPLLFTPANVVTFLTAFPHYLKQVEAAVRNHASFFGRGSAS